MRAREAYSHVSIIELKVVLKPDVFKEFELKEKTVISHNVAMYVFSNPSPSLTLRGH